MRWEDEVDSRLPPNRNISKWKTFSNAVWNPKEKAFLGRTAKKWGILGLFYLIFYIVLAALFSICMWGLLVSLDPNQPYYILQESLIGLNPGVGFRPQFVDEGSLIWINKSASEKNSARNAQKYIDNLNEFLEPYLDRSKVPFGGSQASCEFQRPKSPEDACAIDMNQFENCSPENDYGYRNNSPCIFIKLNRIYGWIPEYYDDPNSLPSEMPQQVKELVTNTKPTERQQVWISCEPEDPADMEMLGEDAFNYEPSPPGLPHFYFPYTNQPGYISPIIAVQFKNPPLNRIVNVRCHAWAKNIKYSKSLKDLKGSTHIELMIDD